MRLLLLFLLIPILTFSQNETDDLVGITSRIELQNDPYYGPVFQAEYAAYTINEEVLNELKTYLYSYQISIVMGTWCGDSQEQVPHFIKILDQLDYNTKNLRIIGVDHQKSAEGTNVDQLAIERVPTFIIYDAEANEIGRIIETPTRSLEEDLLDIIKK
jgi:thiol-disulfide isomerase/thioredoxin